MLRGAQTPGELKQRSERLHSFADLAAVEATLDGLVERGYVVRHERRPGQKEPRYEQLLGGLDDASAGDAEPESAAEAPAEVDAAGMEKASRDPDLVPAEDRLTRLEREFAELRTELASLREALGDS